MNHLPPKKSALLSTAEKLFTQYGMKRVTVEEICRQSGVSKMTFYKYFRNKIDIGEQVIDRLMDWGVAEYRKIMVDTGPYSEKIKRFIRFKMKAGDSIGESFLKEMFNSPYKSIREKIRKRTRDNLEIIKQDFKEAQDKGWIRSDLKVDFLIYILNQMSSMASDENLMRLYDSPKNLVREMISLFFYGIFPEESPDEN